MPPSIERQAQENLIRLARAWCTATGSGISAAGRQTVGDSRFFTNVIRRYEAGERAEDDRDGSFTFRLYGNVVKWFHDPEHWPDELVKAPKLRDLTHTEDEENLNGETQSQQEPAEKRRGRPKIPQATRAKQTQRAADGASAALRRLRGGAEKANR